MTRAARRGVYTEGGPVLALLLVAHQALGGAVEVRWGLAGRVRHDEIFSHVPYGGVSPVRVGAGLTAGDRVHHRVALGADLTSARAGASYEADRTDGPDFGIAGSPFARVDLRWTSTWASVGPLRVGFAVEQRVDTTSYDHGFTGVFGYMAVSGIGPAVEAGWRLSDRVALEVGGSAPIAAWVARSPYAMNDDDYIRAIASHKALPTFGALIADGALQTVDALQAPNARARLSYALGDRWEAVATLDVTALRHTNPRPVTDLTVALDAGVARRW